MSGQNPGKISIEDISSVAANSTNSTELRPDVRSLMKNIRERVRNELKEGNSNKVEFVPFKSKLEGERKAGELLNSEELRYLNQNHAFSLQQMRLSTLTSHRPGFIGKVIVKCKRKLLGIIWESLLKGYFQAEKEYQANLVRYLNDIAKYVDSRDAFIFWELIRKIDYDVNRALERIERIADDHTGELRSAQREIVDTLNSSLDSIKNYITDLQASDAITKSKLSTVESVVTGLERIIGQVQLPIPIEKATSGSDSSEAKGQSTLSDSVQADFSYVLLENRYRGSEDEISARMSIYSNVFESSQTQPVLEIGAGRGELQGTLRNRGVLSYGVDLDSGMVEQAKERSLDVRLGDGIEHLRGLKDSSLSGLIATQVVEHLSLDKLVELIALSKHKVRRGGRVVFETINSESLVALAHHYFRDPTHAWPLHPDTMRYLLEMGGLKVVEVKKLSPFPSDCELKQIAVEDYMTPRWANMIERLNGNFRQLNSLLYGFQDYCIIAEA